MSKLTIPLSVFSIILRIAQQFFNRKHRQRRAAEAAMQLVSVLDGFVADCAAVATDNGYDPFSNPDEYDYHQRKQQCQNAVLSLPDIRDRELLPLSFMDRARAIENRQRDTSQALLEAFQYDDGSGDLYYAKRQMIFSKSGLLAVLLAQELRTFYHLMPPSSEHRQREAIIERSVRYHDGYSMRLRKIERRIARHDNKAADQTPHGGKGGN